MARKEIVTFADDFDGAGGAEPVRFSLDGKDYVIDLIPGRALEFRSVVRPYAEAGRKVRQGPGRPASTRRRSAEIRRWAIEHGHKLPERGRIPIHVVEAYEAYAA